MSEENINIARVGGALVTTSVPVTVVSGGGTGDATAANQTTEIGHLATIAGKDFATSAKQDTGNSSLSTIAAKDFSTSAKQDTGNSSLATIAAKDFATAANQATEIASLATLLGLLLAQGAAGSSATGPMMQALVADAPQSYLDGYVQPISLTSEGRVRVATSPSLLDEDLWGSFEYPIAGEDFFPNELAFT